MGKGKAAAELKELPALHNAFPAARCRSYRSVQPDREERSNREKVSPKDISYGLNRVALGLAKKVLLANQLSIIADNFLGKIENSTVVGAWFGVTAYALQIFFDFSGYSDIAIGLGRVFGFQL